MRWELNDLARRLDDGVRVVSLNESVSAAPIQPEATPQPTVALQRILQTIDSLPDPEREVFNLVRVQGMTHMEAAKVIGVSAKTVQRRLTRGLVRLEERLSDLQP
jgi:RNA polymerase sigma-70 factor (ECF subfamily)